MKITAVESLILLERFHLIKVHTDEQVAGIGAVSPMNAHVTDAFVQKALVPLIVGRNPLGTERPWAEMYKLGPAGAHLNAMAGIDIALWDIAGKVAGLPLYQLLGGEFRRDPQVYASSMVRDLPPARRLHGRCRSKSSDSPATRSTRPHVGCTTTASTRRSRPCGRSANSWARTSRSSSM